jgi:hypothetical protein
MITATLFAVIAVQADVFTISTNAPTANVVESFNTLDYTNTTATLSGMGPNRIELSGTKNRYAGQSVTINPTNNVQADSITFRAHSDLNFNDGGTNTFELYIVADNAAVGSYTYDFSTNSIVKGDYLTFDLGGVTLNAGVEYEFQMYYSEFDDDNKFLFERDQGGNSYAGGALFSGADTNAAIAMPVNNAWLGGTSDMTFFIQGTTSVPPVQPVQVSGTAPSANILESFEGAANNSIGPRRLFTKGTTNDRTMGQTFTIDTDTAVTFEALTLITKTWPEINFTTDGLANTFLVAFMKDTNNDGKTDKILGSYEFDVSDLVVLPNKYITFNLPTAISNQTAGVYSFETYFKEDNDLHDIFFERASTGNPYTGGGSTTKAANPLLTFPNDGLSPSADSDMHFYIGGTESDKMPVVYTASTNAPNTGVDMLEYFEVSADRTGWDARRMEEPASVGGNNRVLGQTFTLDHAGEATITAITARQHPDWTTNLRVTTNTHTYLVAISADTDGDGKGDTPMGTFEYDFTSEFIGKGEYFTFHLGDGISGVTGGVYQVEYYWGEVDPDSRGLNMERANPAAGTHYTRGKEYSRFSHNGAVDGFPALELGGLNEKADLTFYVHGSVFVPTDPYDAWAAGYPGFSDTDLESDPEGDGLNNMMEYALNGDPTQNDAATVKPATHSDGSWFIHVHTERVGDASLSYEVQLDQNGNLPMASWATNGIEWVADSAVSGDYKSVTNRTDATGSQEFIRLKVEK